MTSNYDSRAVDRRPHHLALGEPSYEFTRHREPVLAVEPGSIVSVETEDAFNGQIRKPGDRRDKKTMPLSNPMNGPISVIGAMPGDTLSIHILDIEPLSGQCATYAGALPLLMPHLGSEVDHQTRICEIRNGQIRWSDRLTIPYQPMVGCIGTAPAIGVPSTAPSGDHGGNMDLREVCPGATLFLPVFVPEGLLYLGDCHAAQGDGEVGAAALEMPARVTIELGVRKQWRIPGPRIEGEGFLAAVASARNLEDSVATAYARLALWLEADYGWNRWEANSFLTQVGEASIGYFTAGAVAAKISKHYAVSNAAE